MSINTSKSTEDKLRWVFKIYDFDRNGKIDKKEMLKMIRAMCEFSGKDPKKANGSFKYDKFDKIFTKV